MFMLRITAAVLLLGAALAAGGCTSSIVPPTAQVKSIALVDQSAQGVRVQVTVELTSDNDIPLPLVRSNYTVARAGVGTFAFEDRPNRAIPAKRTDINAGPATQLITLIAAFATTEDVKGRQCQVSGTVTYEPPGEIRRIMTDTSVPLPNVPFSGAAALE